MQKLCVCALLGFLLIATRPSSAVSKFHLPLRRRSTNSSHLHDIRSRERRLFDVAVPILGPFTENAYFYADVYVGTPPKIFSVITDTGSSLMAFPCKQCSSCGKHEGHRYDPQSSSTSSPVSCRECDAGLCNTQANQCAYSQRYSEGSELSGLIYKDKCWLGYPDSPATDQTSFAIDFTFGCHHVEHGQLFNTQQADGIMGLGRRSTSMPYRLQAAHVLDEPIFALCLAYDGGMFGLGGSNHEVHLGEQKWVNMEHSSMFYAIKVKNMKIGSATINVGTNGIVDSGTTFSYVPNGIFQGILTEIDRWCATPEHCKGTKSSVPGEGLCYQINSQNDLETFPSLTIDAGTVSWTIGPDHLFANMSWQQGSRCLSFYSGGGSLMLGANVMMGHDFTFDLKKQQIGIAPAACQLPRRNDEIPAAKDEANEANETNEKDDSAENNSTDQSASTNSSSNDTPSPESSNENKDEFYNADTDKNDADKNISDGSNDKVKLDTESDAHTVAHTSSSVFYAGVATGIGWMIVLLSLGFFGLALSGRIIDFNSFSIKKRSMIPSGHTYLDETQTDSMGP